MQTGQGTQQGHQGAGPRRFWSPCLHHGARLLQEMLPPTPAHAQPKSRSHHCWGRGEGKPSQRTVSEEEEGSGQAAVWVRWSVQGVEIELTCHEKVAYNH